MTTTGSNRVIRGGSWNNNAQNLRSAYRNNNGLGKRNNNVGFRVVSTRFLNEMVRGRGLRITFAYPGFVQVIIPALMVDPSDEYH